MNSNISRILVCMMISGWLLTGCLRLGERPAERISYVFTAERPGKPGEKSGSAVLQVTPMRISPRFNSRSFVYRKGASRYQTDYYHQFLIAPASLIQEEVVHWLAASPGLSMAGASAGPLPPDYLLQGHIIDLYADYRQEQPSAILEIAFLLLEHPAVENPVLLRRRYRSEIPAGHNSPDALIKAWDCALTRILENLEKDLIVAIEDHRRR